jgi:hypothetical protein
VKIGSCDFIMNSELSVMDYEDNNSMKMPVNEGPTSAPKILVPDERFVTLFYSFRLLIRYMIMHFTAVNA